MVAIVALLIAVGLLVAGWSDGDDALLAAATGLGAAVAVGLVIDRVLARRASGGADASPDAGAEDAGDEHDEAPEEDSAAHGGTPADALSADVPDDDAAPVAAQEGSVVFIAGRTTFHRPGCSAVAGKAVSRSTRDDLEAGGMTPCRSCLRDPSSA